MEIHNQEYVRSPKKVAHIGIAVHSIDDVLPFYKEVLGLTCHAIEKVGSEDVRVAFLMLGETMLELLEPLNENSSLHTFLQKRGEGLHHIAFEVYDLKQRIRQLRELGVRMVDEQPKKGANDHQVAFLHPSSTFGVLFEFCQETDKER